ncbi:ABC transporter substrate-binding protein [Candidatus Uabimicrobium amorphum]|nr:ABC transporter substrate-binding protein [Candidatus Uabimicrobium amorphum]
MKWIGILCLLLFLGCNEQSQKQLPVSVEGYPLQITDAHKQVIEITAPPQKIVVAGTALYAQIVDDLQASKKIVGLTQSKNVPAKLQKITSVGQPLRPNLEKIISLQPDVVFGVSNDIRHKLQQVGIPVFIAGEPPYGVINSLLSLHKAIRDMDRILHGNTKQSEHLIQEMQAKIDSYEEKVTKKVSVAVVYFSTQSTPYVVGKPSIESELLEKAGGQNVFDKSGSISVEDLIKKNPQIIFTDPSQIEVAKQNPNMQKLQAVVNGRLVAIKASSWVSTNLAQTFAKVVAAVQGK